MRYKRFLLSVLFIMLSGLFLTGCSTQKQVSVDDGKGQSAEIEKEDGNYDTTVSGVVKSIDSVQKSITIYDMENQLDIVFTYSSGTDVRDSYNKMITMDQLDLGEIVTGYYHYSNRKLTKVEISSEAWTYSGVETLSMDQTKNCITIAKKRYQYDERLVITDGDRLLLPIDLNEQDELTVKGIGKYIYSIRVTKGHGYIRLKNYDAFVGGTIEVGYGIIVPVVEDMLLVAQEGSYRVIVENGELQAVKNITLFRDEEVTLDLVDYKPEAERIGYVTFHINPVGADLYVNGILVNYADPVKLNYGEHIIRVSLTGYQDFTGILNIGETTSTVRISLAENSSDSATGGSADYEAGTSDSLENDSGSSSKADESGTTLEESKPSEGTEAIGTIEMDEDHTITIQGPEGAKVYLNGTLKGTVPLTIPKEIGTHTITLSKTGYITKSYTVEVENNGEDITFNFPDMTEVQS